jgi:hypothetical protein
LSSKYWLSVVQHSYEPTNACTAHCSRSESLRVRATHNWTLKKQEVDAIRGAIGCFFSAVFLAACFTALPGWAADGAKITVLNPRGIQPPIRQIPMATRPDTLDGKTIYIVDTKFPQTRDFVEELAKVLKERHPKTTWVIKDKIGNYMDDDPKLWAEIKEKGQGAIVLVGH